MDPPTLSSFSKEFIDANVGRSSYRLKEIVTIPLLTTSVIIDSHFPTSPNFVSLDVEGHDEQIMKAWDFTRYRPEVFCVETLSHHDHAKVQTITPVFMNARYVVFADTYINTIYVDATVLEGLRSRG